MFSSPINTSFLNSWIELHEALILSIVQYVFEIWYLNTSMLSDSGVVRTWCTAANTALSEGSLTMFPLHSLDKDCSTD